MVASQQEDDVSLALVHIVVLEKKDLVDSVCLEFTELDEQTDSARQTALDNQILLASNLLSLADIPNVGSLPGGVLSQEVVGVLVSPCL